MDWILIVVGSAAGGLARYWVGHRVFAAAPTAFPTGTFVINLAGSCLIGFLAVWPPESALGHSHARLLLMTGFCGAFTTFSAFMAETSALADSGAVRLAGGYVVFSVAAGFLLFRAGAWLGRALR